MPRLGVVRRGVRPWHPTALACAYDDRMTDFSVRRARTSDVPKILALVEPLVARRILLAWVITIPAAASVAAVTWYALDLLGVG